MELSPLQMSFAVISLICYLIAYMYVSEFQYPHGTVWMRIRDLAIAVILWFFFMCGIHGLNNMESRLRTLARTSPSRLLSCLSRLGALVFQITGDIVFPACSTFLPDRIPKDGGFEMCAWVMAAIVFASFGTVEYRDYGFGSMVQSVCLSILYVSADNNVATLFVVTSVWCIQRVGNFAIKEIEIWTGRDLHSRIRKECLRIVGELEEDLVADGAAGREKTSQMLKRLKEQLEKIE